MEDGIPLFMARVSAPGVTDVVLFSEYKLLVCWHEWRAVWCVCEKCATNARWRRTAPAGCQGVGVGWVALLVGSRIECCQTHTELDKVTDAGLKAFSAALGSSTTITTVMLAGKYEWLVKLL